MLPSNTSTTLTADWVNEANQHVWNLTAKKQAPDELSSSVNQMGSKLDQFKVSANELQKTSQLMQSLQTAPNNSFSENRFATSFSAMQRIDNAKELSGKSTLSKPSFHQKEKTLVGFIEKKVEGKVLGVAEKFIHTKYGKTASLSFALGSEIALNSPDEESENPHRDLVISSACSVGVGEALAFGLKQIPHAKIITIPLALHDLTIIGQEHVTQLAQNKEIKECWNNTAFLCDNPSFETHCAIAQGVLQVCKTPGDCVGVVTDYASEKIAIVADDLGITEKNIISNLETMGKFNPYEDTWWK